MIRKEFIEYVCCEHTNNSLIKDIIVPDQCRWEHSVLYPLSDTEGFDTGRLGFWLRQLCCASSGSAY